MRLRLRIERNELPAVPVLWTIEPTALKQTVAQFLQRVDERVPLEGESWGLEDYAVTVGGFEAFHFSEVGDCFQNEDEVIIKPLQYVDVRARTITGRDQITSDGRHLLDGVPFGKPLLKRPRRPDVRIPPRKRQRLEVENGTGVNEDMAVAVLADMDEDEDEDEDDEDFEMSEGEANGGAGEEKDDEDSEEDSDEDSEEDELPVTRRRTRRQRIINDETEELDEDDEDDESDEDFSEKESDSSQSDSDSSSSDGSSDASSSDSSDDFSEASWNGIETSPAKPSRTPFTASDQSREGPVSLVVEGKEALVFNSPPHEGAERTKERNVRRRDSRKLRHLKEIGVLDPTATRKDMREWQQTHGVRDGPEVKKVAKNQAKIEAARKKLVKAISEEGGVDMSDEARFQHDSPAEANEKHPSPVKEAVLTNGDQHRQEEAQDEDEAPEEESSASPTARLNGLVEQQEDVETEDVHASRRARINLAGANRLVFGSLGVRTPRTQADKDALQKKLSARASRNVPVKDIDPVQPEPEVDEDPEAWRDKIELSAVECCDEGVELSTPPYPFQQYWDPQYQYSKKRKRSANSKSFKARKTANGSADYFVETYDKYNTNGEGDALNYDDPEDDEEDDSYWEEGALLGDEVDVIDEQPGDGFPMLPTDLSALPAVAEADALEGDFITYKELVCSAGTNWMPTTLDRTVRLDSKATDGNWTVTFATRDKRPKRFDDEGNRIYSKFEMEGLSDDEGNDKDNVLTWSTLQEPKLLQRAARE